MSRRERNNSKIDEAAKALEAFSGHDAEFTQRVYVPNLREVWLLGKLHHIGYTAKRDGITRTYKHVFSSQSRPHLVVSFDGTQLGIIGGRFRVTDRGITDL